jgi:hypothetical protein
MKGKTFGILLVAAALLVGVALLRQGSDKTADDVMMGKKLFADLPVNQVASVSIAKAGDRVSMVRGEKTWQVQERSGYPADFGELRDMVVNLSRLKIGRSFAGTPESLARLALLPPSPDASSGTGTAVTLKDAAGKVLADVILGQTRDANGGGSGGQYLKRADSDTVYLVDGNFRFLKTTPTEWLAKDILDIDGKDVRSVTCYVAGGAEPVYRLTRASAGEPAALTPMPDGRTVNMAKIDQVMDAISPLTLDDVASADAPPPADGSRLVYQLFDGREITLYPAAGENDSYSVRVAAAQLPVAVDAKPEPAADTDAAAAPADAASANASADTPPVVKTAQEINEALGPWVFTIKKWQYDSLITDPVNLLEAPESTS